VENLQNIEKIDTNSEGINGFDEFDAMAARDWAGALIACVDKRKILEKFNNQIQTAPTDDTVWMLNGIEILAELLGAELKKVQSEGGAPGFTHFYFSYKGKLFIQRCCSGGLSS